jgi:hypothetical protein
MKKLILILFTLVLLTSCNQRVYDDWTITSKRYSSKDSYCNFYYQYQGYFVEFQDSCYKYNIGDKIK